MDRLGVEMLCVFGMPPVEYAVRKSPLGRSGRDAIAPVVGRGVLQVGLENASVSGSNWYRVRISSDSLILDPPVGGLPWYEVPSTDIAGVDTVGARVAVRLVDGKSVVFRRYEGKALDQVVGQQSGPHQRD